MKIGLGPYGMQAPPESGFSHVQLYREMLEQIEVAEELGYDSVWLTEPSLSARRLSPGATDLCRGDGDTNEPQSRSVSA